MRHRTVWGLSTLMLFISACQDVAVRPHSPPQIQIVSGNHQSGRAGDWLDLTIRVTDAEGSPLHLARIHWGVSGGSGYVEPWDSWLPGNPTASAITETDLDGYSHAVFKPTALGPHTVSARAQTVGGDSIGVAIFELEATSMLLTVEYCVGSTICFLDPKGGVGPTVPATVEVAWINLSSKVVALTSVSVPEGASGFFSGPLDTDDTFAMIPGVAGIWSYVDEESGASGTLIVE